MPILVRLRGGNSCDENDGQISQYEFWNWMTNHYGLVGDKQNNDEYGSIGFGPFSLTGS